MHSLVTPVHAGIWGDQGNGTFKNPILYADYSDPDVIRVGDDYYLVASDFHFFPNIPILHSRDMVNWTIIGHAVQTLPVDFWPDPNWMYSGNGGGIWAPSIRFHQNQFWIFFPVRDLGIWMTTASAITGLWSTPVRVTNSQNNWIDPAPFWDTNGIPYLVNASRGGGVLYLSTLSADGKTVSNTQTIFNNPTTYDNLEGPKLYKRNNFYYIFAPYGGVQSGPQAVLRATNINGPYEIRTVLESGTTTINGPHQGAWVETQTGQSWFFHFQQKESSGRIVHLEPLQWVNDWPVIGIDNDGDGIGEPVANPNKPNVGGTFPIDAPQSSDEFNSTTLGLQWQWLFPPVNSGWSLSERPGYLRLEEQQGGIIKFTRNVLTQKIMGGQTQATIELDTALMGSGQTAGIGVVGEPFAWIGVVQSGSTKRFRMYFTNDWRGGEGTTDGPTVTGTTVWLRINTIGDQATFFYSTNGSSFTQLGGTFQMYFGYWKGMKLGLFSMNSQPDSGIADFNWFHYTHDGPVANPNASPFPSSTPCPSGDVNEDCDTNAGDIKLLLQNWLSGGSCGIFSCDLNQDQKINLLDAALVITHIIL